jgi:hypothetical protein
VSVFGEAFDRDDASSSVEEPFVAREQAGEEGGGGEGEGGVAGGEAEVFGVYQAARAVDEGVEGVGEKLAWGGGIVEGAEATGDPFYD